LVLALLQGFFSGFCGFPPSTKTNTSRFEFDLKQWTKSLSEGCATANSYLFIFWCPTLRLCIRRKCLSRGNNVKIPARLGLDFSILYAIVSVQCSRIYSPIPLNLFVNFFAMLSFNNLPTMQAFVSEYEEKLNELCDKCKQIKQIYNKVLVSKLVKVT